MHNNKLKIKKTKKWIVGDKSDTRIADGEYRHIETAQTFSELLNSHGDDTKVISTNTYTIDIEKNSKYIGVYKICHITFDDKDVAKYFLNCLKSRDCNLCPSKIKCALEIKL